ncbi:VOC family protein [Listeria booriae]|nr:VOC family protein [Listeria booriae]
MMKQIIPYLTTDHCKEAVDYYHAIFGGEIKNFQMSDGIPGFEEYPNKVLHAEIVVNEQITLYLNDIFQTPVAEGNSVILGLEFDSEAEITKVYKALAEEGSIEMELQEAFWGAVHAKVVDKFGFSWELNWEK